MAVMLGGELYYEKNTYPAYENRHIVHKQINDAIRSVAEDLDIYLIDVNKYYLRAICAIIKLVNIKKGAELPDDQSESSAPPTHKGLSLLYHISLLLGTPKRRNFLYARTVCEDIHDEACW